MVNREGSILIPSLDLDELRAELQNLSPAIEPEEVGWKDPILAVFDLMAEMGRKPGRDGFIDSVSGMSKIDVGMEAYVQCTVSQREHWCTHCHLQKQSSYYRRLELCCCHYSATPSS